MLAHLSAVSNVLPLRSAKRAAHWDGCDLERVAARELEYAGNRSGHFGTFIMASRFGSRTHVGAIVFSNDRKRVTVELLAVPVNSDRELT